MPDVPTIETPRLRLRGWRDDDVEAFAAMNADPRVTEFLRGPYTRERSAAAAREIREALERKGYGWWVVEERGGANFAGLVVLQNVPFDAAFTPANEIGWRFPYAQWGRGFATEGARAALDYAYASLGWDEVVAFTAAGNVRSRRVMERLGMSYDPRGDFDHPRLAPGDPLLHHVLYRIRRAQ